MDMSRSSEYRIKEAVNILKIGIALQESGDREKRAFLNFGLQLKMQNPHMFFADESEAFFVPYMLTHQEYKYMIEHLEELMNDSNESNESDEPDESSDSIE